MGGCSDEPAGDHTSQDEITPRPDYEPTPTPTPTLTLTLTVTLTVTLTSQDGRPRGDHVLVVEEGERRQLQQRQAPKWTTSARASK